VGENAWVFLVRVRDDLEAQVLISFLQNNGLAAKMIFRSAASGLRPLLGQARDVDIFVPGAQWDKASALLEHFRESQEDMS
jgi:hypothetical protein